MHLFRHYVARPFAERCFSERPESLYTEKPLPEDYGALREAMGRKSVTQDELKVFEEEWKDVYDLYD